MKTSARLLAFVAPALAALSACVVSTGDLEPKTAADCQPFEKPCGYRCVSLDDPGTGCSNESCDAVDLFTDPSHCGACGHSCTLTACVEAVCLPESLQRGTAGDLRGIAEMNGTLYWLEGSQGGRLVSWSPSAGSGAFTNANAIVVTTLLDAAAGRSNAPSASRISALPSLGRLYVAGSGGGLPTNNLTLWEIDPSGPSKTSFYSEASVAGIVVDGIAATGAGVHYVRSDDLRLAFAPPSAVTPTFISTSNTQALRGLAVLGNDVYYGFSSDFGTLARVSGAGAEVVVARGVGTLPHRLAAVVGGSGALVYFASEDDGSARLVDGPTLVQIYSGSGVPHAIDVAADSNGAYFFDPVIGEVLEYRADGWFFPLARGAAPFGIAVDSTYVYWTDASGSVMRVPK
ncbi:MAG TPA: hypothetical protein VIV57_01020 [Anaeromyxobacter sp.]